MIRAGLRRTLVASLGVLLMVVALATQVSAQSPVTMDASLDRNVVTVGDRIKVTVELTLPEDAQADLTTLESQFGDLELLVVGLPQDTILPDGQRQRDLVTLARS